MQFNSIDFAIFLPIVFLLYWFVFNKNLKLQNVLLLVASYIFYGWWDWRFLILIFITTLVDFTVGILLDKEDRDKRRKYMLIASIFINLGILGFFKYYNFFVDNFIAAFSFFGTEINPGLLNVVLPVGISFYTFQTLSYTIDVYRRKIDATRSFIDFAAFVSFFPQLVAGPIERAANLLPQFARNRIFEYDRAVDGLRQILWGLFMKMVIADNCAMYVNAIYADYASRSASELALAAIFFSFQIYGDFAGYSNIAIGTARLFGFNLMRNFAYPYFSRNMSEFWRRWHISLSTWFRDYVYIPLGGSRGGWLLHYRNLLILFAVSGIWHGANWTFVAWGLLNAIFVILAVAFSKNTKYREIVASDRKLPTIREVIQIVSTFMLTSFAWIFFRSDSIGDAIRYMYNIFDWSLFTIPDLSFRQMGTILIIIAFVIMEWIGRDNQYAIEKFALSWPRPLRWVFYYGLIAMIIVFQGVSQTFIYFQF